MSNDLANKPSGGGDHGLPGLILVDDDQMIVESLSFVLGIEFNVHTAVNRQSARTVLQRLGELPSLALIDLGLPPDPHGPDEGFALIKELLAFNDQMKILVLSGQSDRANIQHALTLGAVDFVPKPCDADLLRARLNHQLLILDAEQSVSLPSGIEEEALLGNSPVMKALRDSIAQFANTPFPVLIEGESGCGKELVAQRLHNHSDQHSEPLLTINCAAFTPDLLEAQLFGHAKGAYTGAEQARSGFFEDATNGTLVLDEVGEMPFELQSKFLRVLENGEYYRLGETRARHSDARIIAATNKDLREAVRVGEFRADLFHRLSVLSISVPPLRSRGRDWKLLLDHFRQLYAGTIKPFELSTNAEELFDAYVFPGNVRELRNIVIRLGTRYSETIIDASVLRSELEPDVGTTSLKIVDTDDNEHIATQLASAGFQLDDEVAEMERRYITVALNMSHGNLSKAARLLGVNRTTLYSKVSRLGLGQENN
ncbi:MAG: DNA-binding NtrC family response regulator [Gammaproteobacteria bacterium]